VSNVIHFRSAEKKQQAIREQACLWVVKLSAGPSSRELEEIHIWLDESPEHVKALLSVACLWDQVSVLSELSDIFPLEEYVASHPPPSKRGLVFSALAFLLLVFCLQTPFLDWLEARWEGLPRDLMQLSYETRIGQQSTVVLPDGSEVLLNTNSRIEVSFSATSRDIILHRGEAQFTVTKDKARPFRVHANGGIVEAVGTMFTVQETPEKTLEVTVIEGIVNFTRTREQAVAGVTAQQSQLAATMSAQVVPPAVEPIPLAAGESVQVEQTSDTILKQTFQPEELETRLAWREGMLLFEGDPLEHVIHEVSRYTSIRIDVDENVRDIAVLGYFRTGDIEGVLLAVQNTFNLKVERLSEDHIVLTANN
jgi:transmembrane sensor